jgi:uncharacterized protein YbjQ (UPF0145 family)
MEAATTITAVAAVAVGGMAAEAGRDAWVRHVQENERHVMLCRTESLLELERAARAVRPDGMVEVPFGVALAAAETLRAALHDLSACQTLRNQLHEGLTALLEQVEQRQASQDPSGCGL